MTELALLGCTGLALRELVAEEGFDSAALPPPAAVAPAANGNIRNNQQSHHSTQGNTGSASSEAQRI